MALTIRLGYQRLRDRGLCQEGIEAALEAYPEGVPISDDADANLAVIERLTALLPSGDVPWAVSQVAGVLWRGYEYKHEGARWRCACSDPVCFAGDRNDDRWIAEGLAAMVREGRL